MKGKKPMILENNELKIIIGKKNLEDVSNANTSNEENDSRELLFEICQTISEGGYSPVSQLVGYILSDDPTHISNYKNARTMMNKIDRHELVEDMVKVYIEQLMIEYGSKGDGDND